MTEWVLRPSLRPGKVTTRTYGIPTAYETMRMVDEMRTANLHDLLRPGLRTIEEREADETLVEQAQRFGWVAGTPTGSGVVLTDLGRALLRADTAQMVGSEVVVLDGDGPLAWSNAVAAIADAGECMIVDPYMKIEQFLDLLQYTNTARVLMRRPDKKRDLVAWQVCTAMPDTKVEVRVADRKLLHDRYIVGDTAVFTLGCSLEGVGRKPTTMTQLTGEVADRIREIAEGWWNAAEHVGEPPAPEQDETEQAEAESGCNPAADGSRGS
ncbi:hypothetical protein MAUB_48040 [Mycolicibacterium aubagnense]|uniref:Uncharacterized protein n=1 Tax=Mycolicibacterium aubagnense TaxID=319707 RepID=A0ABN5Z130_9MYCO|nr:hypothetical protein [Mycolicibacterium aubagnense]TLH58189.1 hypothetical protein C1S80_21275 [Mycolicibacterium aubagnense]BBX86931.1 hypothetical protein MAUB_48040 [Mycolicibacterium aubagnense]